MTLDRRTFLRGALGATGVVALGTQFGERALAGTGVAPSLRAAASVDPASAPIEHIVVVMMENRSFDHFLGWMPGSNGRQSGLSYVDPGGKSHSTFHSTQLNGCGFNDPDHSYKGGRLQYDGGNMDGFLTDASNDLYAISYYEAADRPFMSQLALAYTACDNYFCSILGPTYPNRFFQHAGGTDRLSNTSTTSTLPTIWDQLNLTGGPTGKYYFNDLPFLALWGSKYLSISARYEEFLADASAGTLPNVSYVDPRFLGEGQGVSNDDHPAADLRAGDALLSEIFTAVSNGPGWANTVLVINYDEWGGFYDHVAPTRVTPGSTSTDKDVVNNQVLLGFRVPCIVASPFTKGGGINSTLYDHTSVLKLIEWRWGLKPLGARDASTLTGDPANLLTALNFTSPSAAVPTLPTVTPPPPVPCAPGAPSAPASPADDTWGPLQSSGLLKGWGL